LRYLALWGGRGRALCLEAFDGSESELRGNMLLIGKKYRGEFQPLTESASAKVVACF